MDQIATLEQQAIDFAKRGDFGVNARDVNEELTRLAPANQSAWTRLGRCCLELGQLDEATAALDSALQLNPLNTIARNLQMEVTRRRTVATTGVPAEARASRTRASRAPRAPAARKAASKGAPIGGFGRQEFLSLGQLSPESALDALGPRIEAVLMALNERPFAAKVVEARNRAGQAGSRLYRRNSFHSGGPGCIYAVHHGGRREPQLNLAFCAASRGGRDSVRAGIGFDVTQHGTDAEGAAGQERAFAYFEQFQQLVASSWRQLLTDWMGANGAFIQSGENPPSTDLMPKDAIAWLLDGHKALNAGRVFCGRWLFADRAEDAVTLADFSKLVRWADHAFTDLLPLWSSVYREAARL